MSPFKKEKLIELRRFTPKSLSQILNDLDPQMLQDTAISLCKNLGEGDTQSPSHGDTTAKIQAQNMDALPKNQVEPLLPFCIRIKKMPLVCSYSLPIFAASPLKFT